MLRMLITSIHDIGVHFCGSAYIDLTIVKIASSVNGPQCIDYIAVLGDTAHNLDVLLVLKCCYRRSTGRMYGSCCSSLMTTSWRHWNENSHKS